MGISCIDPGMHDGLHSSVDNCPSYVFGLTTSPSEAIQQIIESPNFKPEDLIGFAGVSLYHDRMSFPVEPNRFQYILGPLANDPISTTTILEQSYEAFSDPLKMPYPGCITLYLDDNETFVHIAKIIDVVETPKGPYCWGISKWGYGYPPFIHPISSFPQSLWGKNGLVQYHRPIKNIN